MATAKSITFEADKDTVFATVIQIIQGAGYIISETNDAVRKIVYYADKPGKLMGDPEGRFEATVSVSGASGFAADTALFTMKVVGKTMQDLTAIGGGMTLIESTTFENDLINFVKNELTKHFPIVATVATNTNAPGAPGAGGQTGGCLILFGFLGLLAAGSGFGCLMLLANMLH